MRFNAPPNWPQPPEGWTPPAGWQPDPAWGPAPPDWQFWISADKRGTGSKAGLVAAAVVLVVVLVIGAAVGGFFLFRGSDSQPVAASASATSTPPTTTKKPSAKATPSQRPSASPTATKPAPAAPASCTAPSGGGTESNPLAPGAGAKLGDYCVSVSRVVKDATGVVLAADASNKPPKNGNFALVSLNVTYNGITEGKTYLDVFVTLNGSDGKPYDDVDCDADLPNGLVTYDPLAPGKSLSADLCLDAPATAVQGGVIVLENYETDAKVYWKVD